MMVCGNGHIVILHYALFFCSLLFKISLSQTEVIKKWVLLSSENKHLKDKKL